MTTELKTRTEKVLIVLHVVAWIIFIGLCIKTGSMLFSFFVSLFINPETAKYLYLTLNLSELKEFNIYHYVNIMSLISLISVLKTLIAYKLVTLFPVFNLSNPFSTHVSKLISDISEFTLGTGIIVLIANVYSDWVAGNGVSMQSALENMGDAGEFLFFAAIIFIIAQVFKRGMEIQEENDLTI